MASSNIEIEARFINIDKAEIIRKLLQLGAVDQGEEHLQEIIFYDKDGKWQFEERKCIRLRKTSKKVTMTFKNSKIEMVDGTKEIELEINDMEKAKLLLLEAGLILYRQQEKKRHTFHLGEVTLDIDTWPSVPPYIEIEGPSEQLVRDAAGQLGLSWNDAIFEAVHFMIEKQYGIPFPRLRYFMFDRIEEA